MLKIFLWALSSFVLFLLASFLGKCASLNTNREEEDAEFMRQCAAKRSEKARIGIYTILTH